MEAALRSEPKEAANEGNLNRRALNERGTGIDSNALNKQERSGGL
jgi:hypothetical protein